MQPRAKIDDTNVALAHAEQIARDDSLELQLVELQLRNRYDARRSLDRALSQTIVAFLELLAIVDFDRSEVDAGGFEIGGDVVEMIGVAEHFVARAQKDRPARFLVPHDAR